MTGGGASRAESRVHAVGRWAAALLVALGAWGAGSPVMAGVPAPQDAAAPEARPPAELPGATVLGCLQTLGSRRRLLGEFGSRRRALEDAGIMPSLYYNHFLGVQAQGGQKMGATARQSGTGDFFLYVDLAPLLRLRGSEMLLQVKAGYGRNVNPRIGAVSDPFDDADGDSTGYIPQLWFQQTLFGERVQVRLGYLDQQIVLDRNAYANSEDLQFMATFLDNNSAIVPLAIALGGTLFLNVSDWLQVIASTADADATPYSPGFDTAFDSWTTLFGYLEADLRSDLKSPWGRLPGTYRMGLIWDPRRKARFGKTGPGGGPEFARGDAGFYLSFDQMVYRERPRTTEGIGLFARYGYRDPDVNAITQFWSLGLQYEGIIPGRGADVLGIGMYSSYASRDLRASEGGTNLDSETGFEVYYRLQVLPWLQITPDWQFIIDPGANSAVEAALVFGLRGRVTF